LSDCAKRLRQSACDEPAGSGGERTPHGAN
jgi:hypothetical protein